MIKILLKNTLQNRRCGCDWVKHHYPSLVFIFTESKMVQPYIRPYFHKLSHVLLFVTKSTGRIVQHARFAPVECVFL